LRRPGKSTRGSGGSLVPENDLEKRHAEKEEIRKGSKTRDTDKTKSRSRRKWEK